MMKNRLYVPILVFISCVGLAERAMAANIAISDINAIAITPIDPVSLNAKQERSVRLLPNWSQMALVIDQGSFTARDISNNRSPVKSVAFTLSCIALLGLMFVRRFKKAFI